MLGLITHEESQAVTNAFRDRCHEFYSNDLQECSGGHPGFHIQGDCFEAVNSFYDRGGIDFLGMHPVCKYLTNSGVRWLASKTKRDGYEWSEEYRIYINPVRWKLMVKAAEHFKECLNSVIKTGMGYVENPIMHRYAMEIIITPPTQIIQPYMFGTTERKATCLWLVGLPKLKETNNVLHLMKSMPKKETDKVHYASPGPEREKLRSKTDPNVAKAFAQQWGVW